MAAVSANGSPASALPEEAGSASAVQEVLSGASYRLQGKEETPIAATKDHKEATDTSTAKDMNHPKLKEASSIRSKAQRSHPRLLVLIACVSYLLLQFLNMDLGLCWVENYVVQQRAQARSRLESASSVLFWDQFAHQQLDNLLDTQLDRSYTESYEQCYRRGLQTAVSQRLRYVLITFPDTRNRTMEWVGDNCDRLHYTPQLYPQSPLPSFMNIVRRSTLKAIASLKYKVAVLRSRLDSLSPRLLHHQQTTVLDPPDIVTQSKMYTEMSVLSRFNITCLGLTRCEWTYTSPGRSYFDTTQWHDEYADALRTASRWPYDFEKMIRAMRYAQVALFGLQALQCGFFLLAVYFSRPQQQAGSILPPKIDYAALKFQARQAMKYLALHGDAKFAMSCTALSALHTLALWYFNIMQVVYGRMQLPIGMFLFLTNAITMVMFFCPLLWDSSPSVGSFWRALQELYVISKGQEVSPVSSGEPSSPSQDAPPTSSNPEPASEMKALHISSLTCLAEDIRRTYEALKAEQSKRAGSAVDSEHSAATLFEPDYDSDVQDASYVDLTGGATSTVSEEGEEGEEWAVVHD